MSGYVPDLVWWLYFWHSAFGHPGPVVRWGVYRFCARCGGVL